MKHYGEPAADSQRFMPNVRPERKMITNPAKAEAELKVFYYTLGKATWFLQHLEDALCTLISLARHADSPVSPEEAYAYLAKTRRKPLGKIVGDALAREIVPKGLDERLSRLVEERNWMIHRSVHENSAHLLHDAKRRKLIARVAAVYSEAQHTAKQVSEVLFEWCRARGIDEKLAERIAAMQMRMRMNGEQPPEPYRG